MDRWMINGSTLRKWAGNKRLSKRANLSRPQIQVPQRWQFDNLTSRSTGHVSERQAQAFKIAKWAGAQKTSQVSVSRSRWQRQFAWTAFLLLITLNTSNKFGESRHWNFTKSTPNTVYIYISDLWSFEIQFEFESDIPIRFESDGLIQQFRIAAPATFAVVP